MVVNNLVLFISIWSTTYFVKDIMPDISIPQNVAKPRSKFWKIPNPRPNSKP